MSDGGYGEICLTTKQLCDGEKNCQSGEDEMKNNYGKWYLIEPYLVFHYRDAVICERDKTIHDHDAFIRERDTI